MSVLDLGARRHNFQKWKIMLNQRVQESSNWSVFMKSIVENNAASNKIANSINISVIVEGMFWKEVRENEKFLETTNFTEHELLDIWYDMQPQIEEQRTRGPKPKVSNIDGFLYSLIWYKTGFDFNQLFTNRNHNDFCYYIPFYYLPYASDGSRNFDQNH